MPTCSASGRSITATPTGRRAPRRTASCVTTRAYNTDSTVTEDTQAVYAQVGFKMELGAMPANLVVGARYEETEVDAANSILVPTALLWQDDNDFQVVRPNVGNETLVTGERQLQQPAAQSRLRHGAHAIR